MATQRKRNPNGAGTITRRKDGRYQAAVYVLQPDGTRARKFAYGKTWAECGSAVRLRRSATPDASCRARAQGTVVAGLFRYPRCASLRCAGTV